MALISFKTYENGNYGKKETNTKNEKHGYFVPRHNVLHCCFVFLFYVESKVVESRGCGNVFSCGDPPIQTCPSKYSE
jgi:hypothetical protein